MNIGFLRSTAMDLVCALSDGRESSQSRTSCGFATIRVSCLTFRDLADWAQGRRLYNGGDRPAASVPWGEYSCHRSQRDQVVPMPRGIDAVRHSRIGTRLLRNAKGGAIDHRGRQPRLSQAARPSSSSLASLQWL